MKTFKEFLLEANKTYAIRIKVAGDLPENFEANLKDCMGKYESISVKKVGATPIQEHPQEFPRLKNKEVIKLLNDNFYCVIFNGRDKEDIYLNGIKYINPDKDIETKSNHEVHTALVDPYKKNIYWTSTVFLNEKYEKLRSWPGLQKENQFPRVIQMMMKR